MYRDQMAYCGFIGQSFALCYFEDASAIVHNRRTSKKHMPKIYTHQDLITHLAKKSKEKLNNYVKFMKYTTVQIIAFSYF